MNNKLAELERRIEAAKAKEVPYIQKQSTDNPIVIATELVSGVIVGVIIGLFFDKIVDSKPLFLIICILLGIVGSCRNIWRRINSSK